MTDTTTRYDTIIIGGGQAGLATAYYLRQQERSFIILDAHERVGDAWRRRWDSLRLFTPARYNGLPGMPFPAPPHSFPTKDEMAAYLETYAARFRLPVKTGVRVERLTKEGDRFIAISGDQRFEARNVVVAMADYQAPVVPAFAQELDPRIVQLHSYEYRNPSQLQEGGVLVVGAGNSGAEIALDLVRQRHEPVWLSGRHPGHIPFRIESLAARLVLVSLVLRFLFHRVVTIKTPVGRKLGPKLHSRGTPLVRVKPGDLDRAGIKRVPKTVGVRDGQAVLEDGRTLDVANVIWATGFKPGFSWIDLPMMGEIDPAHGRGVVEDVPGLYFVGLFFIYGVSSAQIHGIGRDAQYIAEQIALRSPLPESAQAAQAASLAHDLAGRSSRN